MWLQEQRSVVDCSGDGVRLPGGYGHLSSGFEEPLPSDTDVGHHNGRDAKTAAAAEANIALHRINIMNRRVPISC